MHETTCFFFWARINFSSFFVCFLGGGDQHFFWVGKTSAKPLGGGGGGGGEVGMTDLESRTKSGLPSPPPKKRQTKRETNGIPTPPNDYISHFLYSLSPTLLYSYSYYCFWCVHCVVRFVFWFSLRALSFFLPLLPCPLVLLLLPCPPSSLSVLILTGSFVIIIMLEASSSLSSLDDVDNDSLRPSYWICPILQKDQQQRPY